ncbi:uncharacterized protein [Argopecten irradians]|uniref:uncharacterized protein n=1 Tax=Argopecten irradians TaxID=31199 RepID=UPI003719465A
MCDIVDKEARFCYHDDNERMCCESCKRHHTGVKDCEFGNRIADCDPRRCSDYNYATQCCQTCARINNRDTTQVPAAPKPTQGVLFFTDHTHTTLSDTGPKANLLPTLSSPLRHTRKLQDNTLLPQKEIKVVTDADISVPALSLNKGGTTKPLVEMQAVPSAKKFKSHGPYVHQNKLDHKPRPTQRPLTKPPVRPTAPFRRTSSSTARNHWKQQQKIKRQRTQNIRQPEKVPSRSRNQYYNTNHSPKYNKPQKVNNPKHSRMMTTTFRTSLNRQSRKQKMFAFPSQKCVKPDATFMSLKCSWLVRLMKGLCSNALLGSICCEPCTPAKKKEFVCKDHQGCTAKTGAQCYNDMIRSKCCATCKRFDTGYPDCRYGDRESHCSLFLHYMPAYTCGTFKQKCCMSCKSSKAQITTITPKVSRNEVHPSKVNPVVSGMTHSSFQDRTQRFRPSYSYRRW